MFREFLPELSHTNNTLSVFLLSLEKKVTGHQGIAEQLLWPMLWELACLELNHYLLSLLGISIHNQTDLDESEE